MTEKRDTELKDSNESRTNLYIRAEYQTKKWRNIQKWYKNGKHNECEIFQKKIIEEITKNKCIKTNERINIEKMDILLKTTPLKYKDGFEWTENFDGIMKIKKNNYYFNLKLVCDQEGAQNRTLREVYHFMKYQAEYLLKHKTENIFFINILDGNACYIALDKFNYLVNKSGYENIKKYNEISRWIADYVESVRFPRPKS